MVERQGIILTGTMTVGMLVKPYLPFNLFNMPYNDSDLLFVYLA